MVHGYDPCRSIDPAPVKWKKGEISFEGVWQQVTMDVTHVHGCHFLAMIDCEPSRFTVWRELSKLALEAVVKQAEQVFYDWSKSFSG